MQFMEDVMTAVAFTNVMRSQFITAEVPNFKPENVRRYVEQSVGPMTATQMIAALGGVPSAKTATVLVEVRAYEAKVIQGRDVVRFQRFRERPAINVIADPRNRWDEYRV
jgi:hypothetical protein